MIVIRNEQDASWKVQMIPIIGYTCINLKYCHVLTLGSSWYYIVLACLLLNPVLIN